MHLVKRSKSLKPALLLAVSAAALGVIGWALLSGPASAAPSEGSDTGTISPGAQVAVSGPRVEVFPPEINLTSSRAAQSVIVRLTQPNGVTRDLTGEATYALSDPKLAKVDGHTVKPLADGSCQLQVTAAGQTLTVPVVVKDGQVDRPISFKLDVMPVFLKAGCNTGGCHGSSRGKDGFRLSLFGFDADGDYMRLTREWSTRRVNLAVPEDSLLLTKSTGKAQHTGGSLFKEDSEFYRTILRWLQAGAPKDSEDVAKPVSVDLYPHDAVLEGEGAGQQMMVRAKYSDGTERDVTNYALFLTNNDNSATVTPTGMVAAKNRGEAFIMARFNTFTVGSQVIVVPKGEQYAFPASVHENNYIDTLVDAKLKKLRIVPSDTCDDETYLRRAYLDVVGLLPTPEQRDKFVADTDPAKRAKLVDQLLERKEFVELWVMKFAELLKIRSDNNQFSYKSAILYFNWLQGQIERNVPMDQIVQQLLSATGGTFTNSATCYYQVETDRLKIAENTAQVFMGMRIQCAQCHNHPFDRWTMNDYYSFAAFFSQIGRKQGEDPRETIVFNGGGGEVSHPLSGKVMEPKFLGGGVADVKGKDRREVLANWLVSADNPYFSRNLSNVVFQHFMGRGIIDPVDDVRVSNPAVNPELLDALAAHFRDYHYDFKRFVRDICASRTYQLATHTNPTNEADDRNFSHAAIRRIRAEVLLDCISQVTETQEKFKGLPLGSRAVQIADGETTNYFLTTFGRAKRETVCSCEVSMEPNLSQALHLLNGDNSQGRVINGGLVPKLLAEKKSPQEIIDELYQRCFTRKPTADEMSRLMALVTPAAPDEQRKVLEDVFWALLNSEEFMFNH